MQYETITTTTNGSIGIICLNRPNVLNAINEQMTHEVTAAMKAFDQDEAVRAIVLRGEGRAFSAGFDMKETASRGYTETTQIRATLEREFDFIIQFWDSRKPTIAAVHGFCLAGAFELALACDVTVAAEGTRFGEPEVRFGAGIIALILPWIVGPKKAKELLLTGTDQVTAREALEMGIVNRVVPAGEELDSALAIAKDMAAAAAIAVRGTKRAINRTYDIMGMRQALLSALQDDVVISVSGGPEREEFNKIRKEQGLKAALAWRDQKFR